LLEDIQVPLTGSKVETVNSFVSRDSTFLIEYNVNKVTNR
jgi:pseudouridine-5'-phosphate glycosidase